MSKIFPTLYDLGMKPLERGLFKNIRSDLLKRAHGKVIELGSGSGINFSFYQDVEGVTAIEPSQHMIKQSNKRKGNASVPVDIVQGSAEKLPFDDHTYDTVVATLVFCTIPDVEKALQEMRRVCKPNGTILLSEHVEMEHPFLAKLQHLLTPVWKKICDGCCLNRNTVSLLQTRGFTIVELKRYYRGLFVMMEIRNEKDIY